jgi:hypothetical protein
MKKHIISLSFLLVPFLGQAQLQLNELLASNNVNQMDEFFEFDDWIEIYNPGGIINLAGYYLSDDPLLLTKHQIPATDPGATTMLPGSFKVFFADKDNLTQGALHTNFTLSANGETIFLTAPDGVTIIDQITYPQMAEDISYGRACEACSTWQYFNNVTYSAPNVELPQTSELLFLNEVQPENTGIYHDPEFEYDPWIEVYNPNPYQINLGGYYLSVDGNPTQWLIPTNEPYNTVIAPNSFKVFWCDNDLAFGATHSPIVLNPAGGTATLTGPDGITLVSSLTWGALSPGTSAGCSTDGSPTIITFNQATPINSNSLIFITPEPVVINEVMADNVLTFIDNYAEFDDWVEIYNPLNYDVSLAGYFMSDDSNNPRRWQIPTSFVDSVTVPAHGWLTFFIDDSGTQGVRHASFNLNNNNEFIGLYSPDGLTRVDEIAWAHMGADTSLGRKLDGDATWVNFIATTPDASNNTGIYVVGITEMDAINNHFSLYPNPTRGIVQCSKKSNIQIYSIQGNIIDTLNGVWQINFSNYASGIYVVTDEEGNKIRVVKE